MLLFASSIAVYFTIDAAATHSYFHGALHITRDLIDGVVCVFAYAMTALLLRRTIMKRVMPRATWAIAMMLFLVGAILPPLFVLWLSMNGPEPGSFRFATIANPFPRSDIRGDSVRTAILLLWAGTVTMLNAPWFLGQWQRFRRLEGGRPARMSSGVSPGD